MLELHLTLVGWGGGGCLYSIRGKELQVVLGASKRPTQATFSVIQWHLYFRNGSPPAGDVLRIRIFWCRSGESGIGGISIKPSYVCATFLRGPRSYQTGTSQAPVSSVAQRHQLRKFSFYSTLPQQTREWSLVCSTRV